jgi:glycosyltransferase involved in cell wall biosynthesis
MKVAFVSQPGHAVIPPSGSIELWADEVARRLAARHRVYIYATQPPREVPRPAGPVEFRLIPHGSGRTRRLLRRAWRLLPPDRPFYASVLHPVDYWLRVARDIRREGIEVVHVFNYSQALPILRRRTRAKLVLHMHCEWLSQLGERMIERRLRHADLVVGCSDYITDKVRKRFPQHADRCRTIYNGVEIDSRHGSAERNGPLQLLNVGRVSPEKGLHVLVDALERVIGAEPDVRLTILGEESPVPYEFAVKISRDPLVRDLARFYGSSYLEHLRAQMSPAVAERVTFVDRIPHAETRRYYDAADVFVFPSIFEAFPIPPIEAMAAGVPVIASKAGGVVESVVHERTGLLVEREDSAALAEAILLLARDGVLRRSFGEAGRVRVGELFSWPKITADVESAFVSLLDYETPDGRQTKATRPSPGPPSLWSVP